VDVRVIAATHRDLRSIVRQGSFREDLYYGLAAFPVRVPTLRERKDDIPLLTEHFLEHMQDGENSLPLSPVVFDDLESRNEEMETIRETATGGHLYLKRRGRVSQGELIETLNACSGHRAEAARRLGISERTLYRRSGVLPLAAYCPSMDIKKG
jgi:DNA-binding NtrC family response regulator